MLLCVGLLHCLTVKGFFLRVVRMRARVKLPVSSRTTATGASRSAATQSAQTRCSAQPARHLHSQIHCLDHGGGAARANEACSANARECLSSEEQVGCGLRQTGGQCNAAPAVR